MSTIEIKSRWTGAVLYSGEHADVKEAVEAAVKADANLADANLTGATLAGANLADATLARATLAGANLTGANLTDANLTRATLTRATLTRANLTGATLAGANLADATLTDANLTGATLTRANLADANLADANLTGATLAGANLADATLTDANLTGATLTRANLADANLADANLTRATLTDAYLAGAKVGAGADEAVLAGSRPIVQIGPIGSRNDWLLVFWCGDAGVRISTGCQQQITEAYFLERLAEAHGEGEQANIHAQHYIEALAFAKRLLKEQAMTGPSIADLVESGSLTQPPRMSEIVGDLRNECDKLRAKPADSAKVLAMLIRVASAAWHAADDSEERVGDDGREYVVQSNDFDDLSKALDALDELPDDRPGYVMNGPTKAEWALRDLLKPEA